MKLRPTQIVILAAGAVMLIAGFLAFIEVDGPDLPAGFDKEAYCELQPDSCGDLDGESYNAFDTDTIAPLSTWPALLGAVVAIAAALVIFAKKTLPTVLGFTGDQLLFGLAVAAALIAIGWFVQGLDGASFGIGFWLTLIGSIALVAGTAMEMLQADGDGGATAPPATPTAF